MKPNKKLMKALRRYRKDEEGTLAIVWAASLSTVLVAVGAAYDFSRVSGASHESQAIADSVALSAAVFVKNNKRKPLASQEGYVEGKKYDLRKLGFNIDSRVEKAYVTVKYDEKNGEAYAFVSGYSKPAFMQIAGYKHMKFNVDSTVKYESEEERNPASIFLVADVSGSMALGGDLLQTLTSSEKRRRYSFYVSRNETKKEVQRLPSRNSSLKATLKDFGAYLREQTAEDKNPKSKGKKQRESKRYLRMAMYAYSSTYQSRRSYSPNWGEVPDYAINRLNASGGTNPSSAMNKAYRDMKYEVKYHKQETGSEPVRIVVLMTDGVNNSPVYTTQTLAACTAMKADGVQVYTIGYALEEGHYAYKLRWPAAYYQPKWYSTTAYGFLRSCASSDKHFLKAKDSDALKDAFNKIGKQIVLDTIRIAS